MGDKVTFGHYRVLQHDDGSVWELGSSETGVTYKALDTDLQRLVALKVINPAVVADEATQDRFLREARTVAGLRHSNIASIYHLGKDQDQFFYAKEFIEGQTTESYVARYGPLPLGPALRIAWQVSKALVASATQQCVHRDLNPANIMIVADSEEGAWPFVKLIDFGLVRPLPAHASDHATRPGLSDISESGSQEQVNEGDMDVRSEIYSLGCTLWYLLTGRPPFTASPSSDFTQQVGNEAPWACRVWNLLRGEAPYSGSVSGALTQQRPGSAPAWEELEPFPRRVRHLLVRMLRKEFSQRPTSVMELQREIERCLAEVERREALAARIALPLTISRNWLTGGTWNRRAAVFGACAMGLVLALGHYWNSDPLPGSAPPTQTSGVAQAKDFASSNQWLATEIPVWSFLGSWDEPFRSLALARRLSFAETVAADPSLIGAKSWLHADSIWDGAVAVRDNSSSDKVERGSVTVASNSQFAVGGSEEKKAVLRKAPVRNKNQVKKTTKRYSYANYAKKPQRRVTSRAREHGFDPLRVVQQARYQLRRVIRKIF